MRIHVVPGRGMAKGFSVYFQRILLMGAMFLASLVPALGNTITVTSTANSGPGTLRAALIASFNGDVIDARGLTGTIQLTSGQLAVNTSVTILGPGFNNLDIDGGRLDRVFNISSGTTVVISGIAIDEGFFTSTFNASGGGIYSTYANLTVTNCLLIGNAAYQNGGAMYIQGGKVSLNNCVFVNNIATNGGAIYYEQGVDTSSSLSIKECLFQFNTGIIAGGALYDLENRSSQTMQVGVTNCLFTGNVVSFDQGKGGAIYVQAYNFGTAAVGLDSVTIVENSAVFGGGIYNFASNGVSQLTLTNCTIGNNTSGSFGSGGGIYNLGQVFTGSATVSIYGSTISSNVTDQAGGGIFNSGTGGAATIILSNSVVTANISTNTGGGIYSEASGGGGAFLTLMSSTVSSNKAEVVVNPASYNGGGGICNSGNSSLQMLSSTVFGNTAVQKSAGIYNDGHGGGAPAATLINSTVSGNAGGLGAGIGNFGSATLSIFNCTFSNLNSVYSESVTEIGNTILTGSAGSNIVRASGFINTHGYNLCSDAGNGVLTNVTDRVNTDPKIGPLQDNGGPTLTHALLPGSPGFDKGLNLAGFTLDQRGFPRSLAILGFTNAPGGDSTDIGAVEFMPAVFAVRNTSDLGGGSLRSVIEAANVFPDTNTIVFEPGAYGTIGIVNGGFSINSPVSILGPGAANVNINGNASNNVFSVGSGLNVLIAGVGISNGTNVSGGAIFNDHSMLTVSNCAFTGNKAQFGGAIYNASTLGGSSTLAVIGSTFSLNTAGDTGGAIYNDAELSGNAAVTIVNSTFSTNASKFYAGGIYDDGFDGIATVSIQSSTFCGNTNGGPFGNIYAQGNGGTATVTIGDTILSAGATGANLFNDGGTITSLGYNLSSDDGGGFLNGTADQVNTNPQLGPLQNNGGPTFTHALPLGSPAIDKGKNLAALAIDQRGAARVTDLAGVANASGGDGSDIGAFEYFTPATYTVLNLNDSGAGSLRQAILDAGVWPDANDIFFDPSVHGMITLTSGELPVSSSLNLFGPGANNVTVSGNLASRVFSIASGLNVTIAGLTVSNGTNALGGGIFNDHSVLTVSNCAISGNTSFFGGGIYNNAGFGGGNATLTVRGSTFSGNVSNDEGGGIYNDGEFSSATATATVLNSTFSGNSAVSSGGAIWIAGTFGNSVMTVSACTFNGNLTGNTDGGEIHLEGPSGIATLNIGDSILNTVPSRVSFDLNNSTVVSLGYNLASDNGGGLLNGTADQINTNPQLGPLQNNGGSTLTHALLGGSPAIDKGKVNAVASLAATTDQRGVARPIDQAGIANAVGGDGSDIGALEAQLTASGPIRISSVQKLSDGSFQLSFTNTPGAGFTVLTTTNVALPLSNWTALGAPTETSSGHFQFNDPQATNQARRFYNVRSP